MLTPDNLRAVYGVDAEISRHPSGQRVVIPIRRSGEGARRVTLQRRFVRTVAGFGALTAVTLLLAPLVGPTSISLRRAFDFSIPFADNADAQIFFIARLPRTLAGALRRRAVRRSRRRLPGPAAQSAGDAVHARRLDRRRARRDHRDHLQLVAGVRRASPPCRSPPSPARCVAVAIVYALAQARHRGLSTTVLLLAGVTMNAFFSAMILFVQYFASFADTYRTLRWLMGDLDVSSYQPILAALPAMIVAFAVFAWLARPLNLLALGTDSAESRGLDVTRAQRAAFLSASLATGAAVSIGGPIGFIGIIIPHLVRLLVGSGPPPGAAGGDAVRRGVPRRLRPRSRARSSRRWSCRSASSRR